MFLDRDGVINKERDDYTYRIADFIILPGVKNALERLKKNDFLCIVITNQAGIGRGLYSVEEMKVCHQHMMKELDGLIDDIYYCPYYPEQTDSLSRKPGSLMFEKAIAKYCIQEKKSWMVGDKERDLIPAKKLGLTTAFVGKELTEYADFYGFSLDEIVHKHIANDSSLT